MTCATCNGTGVLTLLTSSGPCPDCRGSGVRFIGDDASGLPPGLSREAAMKWHRRVIKIKAEDSPNVRRALLQQARGEEPDGEVVVPGVLTWQEYQHRRATWDKVRQCVGLDAEFWEGGEVLLFPPASLNRAEEIARELDLRTKRRARRAKAMGLDPAEGGDLTAWAVVDERGLLHLEAFPTSDTTVIVGKTVSLMREWGLDAERVCIDLGGGKQHLDTLRRMGHAVRGVRFGATADIEPRSAMIQKGERRELREERYAYKNLRAQMYHEFSLLVDPQGSVESDEGRVFAGGFGLPADLVGSKPGQERKGLRDQLAVIPKLQDDEGRYFVPSKGTESEDMKKQNVRMLRDIVGCSPDEADAVVLAVHGMLHRFARRAQAGVVR